MVTLDLRSEPVDVDRPEVADEYHAVRVSERYDGDRDPVAVDHDRVRRREGRAAHRRGHIADAHAVPREVDHHDTAQRADREVVAIGVVMLAKELGEDADPVAALFGLAPVRIEDANAEIRAVSGLVDREDAVRTDAPVAVTDEPDRVRRQAEGQPGGVDDQVIVPETVGLDEMRHRARR